MKTQKKMNCIQISGFDFFVYSQVIASFFCWPSEVADFKEAPSGNGVQECCREKTAKCSVMVVYLFWFTGPSRFSCEVNFPHPLVNLSFFLRLLLQFVSWLFQIMTHHRFVSHGLKILALESFKEPSWVWSKALWPQSWESLTQCGLWIRPWKVCSFLPTACPPCPSSPSSLLCLLFLLSTPADVFQATEQDLASLGARAKLWWSCTD